MPAQVRNILDETEESKVLGTSSQEEKQIGVLNNPSGLR